MVACMVEVLYGSGHPVCLLLPLHACEVEAQIDVNKGLSKDNSVFQPTHYKAHHPSSNLLWQATACVELFSVAVVIPPPLLASTGALLLLLLLLLL
jgi:hypothetical protein